MSGSPLRSIMLDTSVVVASFRRDKAILERMLTVLALVPTTTIGELYLGAFIASRQEEERANIADLLATSQLIGSDLTTALQYATIRYALRLQGTPIPDNDIWIAASAIQHTVPLATRDEHFKHVPGLTLEMW